MHFAYTSDSIDNCPSGEASVSCTANPCDYTNCYNHPEADCTIDTCGQCSAMFSVNGTVNRTIITILTKEQRQ